jgi:hypothetical protein
MVEDYQSSIAKNLLDGSESEMTFRNQMWIYYTEDGSKYVQT